MLLQSVDFVLQKSIFRCYKKSNNICASQCFHERVHCELYCIDSVSSTSSQPLGSMLKTRWDWRKSRLRETSCSDIDHGFSAVFTGISFNCNVIQIHKSFQLNNALRSKHYVTKRRESLDLWRNPYHWVHESTDWETVFNQQSCNLSFEVAYRTQTAHEVTIRVLRIGLPIIDTNNKPENRCSISAATKDEKLYIGCNIVFIFITTEPRAILTNRWFFNVSTCRVLILIFGIRQSHGMTRIFPDLLEFPSWDKQKLEQSTKSTAIIYYAL